MRALLVPAAAAEGAEAAIAALRRGGIRVGVGAPAGAPWAQQWGLDAADVAALADPDPNPPPPAPRDDGRPAQPPTRGASLAQAACDALRFPEALAPHAPHQFGRFAVRQSEVFRETPLSFAFVNLKPLVRGHVLVSPRRCVPAFGDLAPDEVADLWLLAQRVGDVVREWAGAAATTFAVQDGAASGQTVPHVHVHVLPRVAGDFEPNDRVYTALDQGGAGGRPLDLDIERVPRSEEEMAAEAEELRGLSW